MQGHDFLDAAKNETIWQKAKNMSKIKVERLLLKF